MLKRKIYDELLSWKQKSGGQTALLIDDARRVGAGFHRQHTCRGGIQCEGIDIEGKP